MKYITALTTVGKGAIQLSQMSTADLHDLHLSLRPEIERKAAELKEVERRTDARSVRRKEDIAGEQINRQAVAEYHNWSQSNLPKPIVARRADMMGESMPQNPELEMVTAELRTAKTKYREAEKNMVRFGGPKRLSELEYARKKVAFVEDWMQEVSK
jgi:hypothetical protein